MVLYYLSDKLNYLLKCQEIIGSGIPSALHSKVKWLPAIGVDVGVIEIESIVGGTKYIQFKNIISLHV